MVIQVLMLGQMIMSKGRRATDQEDKEKKLRPCCRYLLV